MNKVKELPEGYKIVDGNWLGAEIKFNWKYWNGEEWLDWKMPLFDFYVQEEDIKAGYLAYPIKERKIEMANNLYEINDGLNKKIKIPFGYRIRKPGETIQDTDLIYCIATNVVPAEGFYSATESFGDRIKPYVGAKATKDYYCVLARADEESPPYGYELVVDREKTKELDWIYMFKGDTTWNKFELTKYFVEKKQAAGVLYAKPIAEEGKEEKEEKKLEESPKTYRIRSFNLNSHTTINIPVGYRVLELGEYIPEGFRYWHHDKWHAGSNNGDIYLGNVVKENMICVTAPEQNYFIDRLQMTIAIPEGYEKLEPGEIIPEGAMYLHGLTKDFTPCYTHSFPADVRVGRTVTVSHYCVIAPIVEEKVGVLIPFEEEYKQLALEYDAMKEDYEREMKKIAKLHSEEMELVKQEKNVYEYRVKELEEQLRKSKDEGLNNIYKNIYDGLVTLSEKAGAELHADNERIFASPYKYEVHGTPTEEQKEKMKSLGWESEIFDGEHMWNYSLEKKNIYHIESLNHTVAIPKGYRRLEVGEIIPENRKWFNKFIMAFDDEIISCSSSPGEKVSAQHYCVIAPIEDEGEKNKYQFLWHDHCPHCFKEIVPGEIDGEKCTCGLCNFDIVWDQTFGWKFDPKYFNMGFFDKFVNDE